MSPEYPAVWPLPAMVDAQLRPAGCYAAVVLPQQPMKLKKIRNML
jgi:hypothetical protein